MLSDRVGNGSKVAYCRGFRDRFTYRNRAYGLSYAHWSHPLQVDRARSLVIRVVRLSSLIAGFCGDPLETIISIIGSS